MADPTAGIVVLLAVGVGCLALALSSLRAGSWIRRLYGIDPDDDAGARANAIVLGIVGAGLFSLATAVALELPSRSVATATILASAFLCFVLGWLVVVRDRRALLTTPNVDRETARRLGLVSVLCGVLILPLAPLIWVGVDEVFFVVVAFGISFVVLLAVAVAYR
jgi:hypothetical protein